MQTISMRHDLINSLRAIGIVLVVLGHTLGISEGVDKYIFSFHMPLFFFLSGIVLTSTRLSLPWIKWLLHYWRRLILPYLLFSLITYLPWVLVTRRYGADAALGVEFWRPVIGTLYGIGVDGWLQHNAMLWFFPCLFVVHLIFRLIQKFADVKKQSLVIVALAAFGFMLHYVLPLRLPWSVEISLIALPFYAIGYAISSHGALFPRTSLLTALLTCLLAAIQLLCIKLNGRVDMNFISLGNPILFYIGAFSGIGALGFLVSLFPPLSVFARIADAAIIAFPLHRTLFSVFSGFGLLFLNDLRDFKLSVCGSVTYAIGALLVAVFLLPWVRRLCPVLIGGR
jgi:acyltransferase